MLSELPALDILISCMGGKELAALHAAGSKQLNAALGPVSLTIQAPRRGPVGGADHELSVQLQRAVKAHPRPHALRRVVWRGQLGRHGAAALCALIAQPGIQLDCFELWGSTGDASKQGGVSTRAATCVLRALAQACPTAQPAKPATVCAGHTASHIASSTTKANTAGTLPSASPLPLDLVLGFKVPGVQNDPHNDDFVNPHTTLLYVAGLLPLAPRLRSLNLPGYDAAGMHLPKESSDLVFDSKRENTGDGDEDDSIGLLHCAVEAMDQKQRESTILAILLRQCMQLQCLVLTGRLPEPIADCDCDWDCGWECGWEDQLLDPLPPTVRQVSIHFPAYYYGDSIEFEQNTLTSALTSMSGEWFWHDGTPSEDESQLWVPPLPAFIGPITLRQLFYVIPNLVSLDLAINTKQSVSHRWGLAAVFELLGERGAELKHLFLSTPLCGNPPHADSSPQHELAVWVYAQRLSAMLKSLSSLHTLELHASLVRGMPHPELLLGALQYSLRGMTVQPTWHDITACISTDRWMATTAGHGTTRLCWQRG